MTDRILPCPFCGESASVETVEGKATGETRFSVGCQKEDCFGYQNYLTFARRGDAISAWNTRNRIREWTVTRAPGPGALPNGDHS